MPCWFARSRRRITAPTPANRRQGGDLFQHVPGVSPTYRSKAAAAFGSTSYAAAERIDNAVDLSRRLQAEARDVCERSRALRAYLLAARSDREEVPQHGPVGVEFVGIREHSCAAG
jgi:hypothetical protein